MMLRVVNMLCVEVGSDSKTSAGSGFMSYLVSLLFRPIIMMFIECSLALDCNHFSDQFLM